MAAVTLCQAMIHKLKIGLMLDSPQAPQWIWAFSTQERGVWDLLRGQISRKRMAVQLLFLFLTFLFYGTVFHCLFNWFGFWHRLYAFLHLTSTVHFPVPVACFPALGTNYLFFRSQDPLRGFPCLALAGYLHLITVVGSVHCIMCMYCTENGTAWQVYQSEYFSPIKHVVFVPFQHGMMHYLLLVHLMRLWYCEACGITL